MVANITTWGRKLDDWTPSAGDWIDVLFLSETHLDEEAWRQKFPLLGRLGWIGFATHAEHTRRTRAFPSGGDVVNLGTSGGVALPCQRNLGATALGPWLCQSIFDASQTWAPRRR